MQFKTLLKEFYWRSNLLFIIVNENANKPISFSRRFCLDDKRANTSENLEDFLGGNTKFKKLDPVESV